MNTVTTSAGYDPAIYGVDIRGKVFDVSTGSYVSGVTVESIDTRLFPVQCDVCAAAYGAGHCVTIKDRYGVARPYCPFCLSDDVLHLFGVNWSVSPVSGALVVSAMVNQNDGTGAYRVQNTYYGEGTTRECVREFVGRYSNVLVVD